MSETFYGSDFDALQAFVLVADLGSIAARVAAEGIRAPALVVVGEVVGLRAELIALARAEAQA